MGARDKIIENGTDFKFNKTKNFCGETVTSLPDLDAEHAGYECIYSNRFHHWDGLHWVRYAAYSELTVIKEFRAEEPSNKIMPQGSFTTNSLAIATNLDGGLYEFDACVGFACAPPLGACGVSAQFACNSSETAYGTRKYMPSNGSTGVPMSVDTFRSGTTFLADITAVEYKSLTSSDYRQVITLHGFGQLNVGAAVTLSYFKDTAGVTVNVLAGSWAKIRKVG